MDFPVVFSYRDPVQFLRDYYSALQKKDPEITVRRWSESMGLPSPLALVAILRKSKPLRLKDLNFLKLGIELEPSELRFLEALVLSSRARTEEEKSVFQHLLSSITPQETVSSTKNFLKETSENVYESEDDELFSHWVDAAVISALRLKATRNDLDLLRKNLLWEKDRSQVDRSFERIRRMGLLDSQTDKPKHNSVTTRTEHHHAGAKSYFAQINRIATEAINLSLDEREFQCFSIPACKAATPEFKEMLRRFRKEIAATSAEDGDVVLQFNLEMFPLTRPIQTDESDRMR